VNIKINFLKKLFLVTLLVFQVSTLNVFLMCSDKQESSSASTKKKKKRKRSKNPFAKFLAPSDTSKIDELNSKLESGGSINVSDLEKIVGLRRSHDEFMDRLKVLASYLYFQALYCNMVQTESEAYMKRINFVNTMHSKALSYCPELKEFEEDYKKEHLRPEAVFMGLICPKTTEGNILALNAKFNNKIILTYEDKKVIDKLVESRHEELKLFGNFYFLKWKYQQVDHLFTFCRQEGLKIFQKYMLAQLCLGDIAALSVQVSMDSVFCDARKIFSPYLVFLTNFVEIKNDYLLLFQRQDESGDFVETRTKKDHYFNITQNKLVEEYKQRREFFEKLYSSIINYIDRQVAKNVSAHSFDVSQNIKRKQELLSYFLQIEYSLEFSGSTESRPIRLPYSIEGVSVVDIKDVPASEKEKQGEHFSEEAQKFIDWIDGVDAELKEKEREERIASRKGQKSKQQESVADETSIDEVADESRADDGSYIVSEYDTHTKISDPKNNIRIVLYKYRDFNKNLSEEFFPDDFDITYHERVATWFTQLPEDALKSHYYPDWLDAARKKYIIQIHNFAKIVDFKLSDLGLQTIFSDKSGRGIRSISIPATIIYTKTGGAEVNEYGYFTYGFLSDGTCYHRCFETKSHNQYLLGVQEQNIKELHKKIMEDPNRFAWLEEVEA
jgi:hypothetical protein